MEKPLTKGTNIKGSAREKLAKDLKKKYDSGSSVRALAEEIGRSYGFVHRLLGEYVQFRSRGGGNYDRPSGSLSLLQRDVLQLKAQGMSNAETAAVLNMRTDGVYACLQRVAKKFGSTEEPQMIDLAYRLGQLDPPKSTTHVEIPADEQHVLDGLADGKTPEQIAESTGVCTDTVYTTLRKLTAQLNAKNLSHLITRGWEVGLRGPAQDAKSRIDRAYPSDDLVDTLKHVEVIDTEDTHAVPD